MIKYEISDGIPLPEINKGGRPIDKRIAAIATAAAKDISEGRFRNISEAVDAYIDEYAGIKNARLNVPNYADKKKDLTKKVKAALQR